MPSVRKAAGGAHWQTARRVLRRRFLNCEHRFPGWQQLPAWHAGDTRIKVYGCERTESGKQKSAKGSETVGRIVRSLDNCFELEKAEAAKSAEAKWCEAQECKGRMPRYSRRRHRKRA
eukprot:811266-Pleurochrysis_carterae.AAC.5